MNHKQFQQRIVLIALAGLVGLFIYRADDFAQTASQPSASPPDNVVSLRDADLVLAEAFENRQSNIQVMGHGTVHRILPDDNDGSRHQRFVLKLESGQTVMVAHNIDVAAKIRDLSVGDRIDFYGEYEWNAQGGVLHWTHRTTNGNHPGGWLKHDGQRYE